MQYDNRATYQSNEIHNTTFWCYFDLHGNTTGISNILSTKGTKKAEHTNNSSTEVQLKQNNQQEHTNRLQKLVDYMRELKIFPEDTGNHSQRR